MTAALPVFVGTHPMTGTEVRVSAFYDASGFTGKMSPCPLCGGSSWRIKQATYGIHEAQCGTCFAWYVDKMTMIQQPPKGWEMKTEPWADQVSPGPWEVREHAGDSYIADAKGETVAAVKTVYPECCFPIDDTDARRIVACVNACVGIDTETLETITGQKPSICDLVTRQWKHQHQLPYEPPPGSVSGGGHFECPGCGQRVDIEGQWVEAKSGPDTFGMVCRCPNAECGQYTRLVWGVGTADASRRGTVVMMDRDAVVVHPDGRVSRRDPADTDKG